ncbi:steroid 17-alpha-hydroxylase/17,20 lyase-like [Dendronephthya gigantea]|uniref:steroid 17-alpha-hydroxylase/17,20 lyase-like n=1 Tax=Dendronephthya gigantea TaxID=151771 RepID=UPI00106B7588|nr:steroid 17-alpha-hydroxylase/17,20 lyase-like [Dendronephthya gigantea]
MLFEIFILILSTTILVLYLTKPSRPPGFPPGPATLPLIGNLHYLGTKLHLHLNTLRSIYGPVYSIFLGHTPIVVISSITEAREAILRQRDTFSGRPYPGDLPYGCQLVGDQGRNIGFGDVTPEWRQQRKIAESALKSFFGKTMEDHVTTEVEKLVKRLRSRVGKSLEIGPEIDLAILNVICCLLFGVHYEPEDDEFQRIVYFNTCFTEGLKPGQLVDVFPWLANFPLTSLRKLRHAVAIRDEILDTKYVEHKATFDENNIRDLTDAILKAERELLDSENDLKTSLTENHLKAILADCFIAGFKTTATNLRWVFVYLLNNPEVQNRIHKEISTFSKPPGLKDRQAVPYLQATLNEVLRCASPVPIPIPHRVTCDTTLCGYNIPKDTTVFLNLWGMNHDPDWWSEPFEFKPERFFNAEGEYDPPSASRCSYIPFSAGRRVCLGEGLSNAIQYLFVSSLLHEFTFEVPVGSEPPDTEELTTAVLEPKPFQVVLKEK